MAENANDRTNGEDPRGADERAINERSETADGTTAPEAAEVPLAPEGHVRAPRQVAALERKRHDRDRDEDQREGGRHTVARRVVE